MHSPSPLAPTKRGAAEGGKSPSGSCSKFTLFFCGACLNIFSLPLLPRSKGPIKRILVAHLPTHSSRGRWGSNKLLLHPECPWGNKRNLVKEIILTHSAEGHPPTCSSPRGEVVQGGLLIGRVVPDALLPGAQYLIKCPPLMRWEAGSLFVP